MNEWEDLRDEQIRLWEAAKVFLEEKRDNNGVVSEENMAVYNRMVAEVDAMSIDIELAKPLSRPILMNPKAGCVSLSGGSNSRASGEYKRDFWNAMRGRPVLTNSLLTTPGSTGGYLVPDQFSRTLVQALEENNIIRPLAHIINTDSGYLQIPVVDAKGSAAWVEETGRIPIDDPSLRQVTLSAHKIGTLIKVSHELMADSVFPLEAFIVREFGRRIGLLEEEAFIVGDGKGKPTGFLRTAQVGKVAQTKNTITIDDIIDLYYSLRLPYRENAVFITNDLTIAYIRQLKDENGRYIWQPSVADGLPDTILGRPVYTSPFMPQMKARAKVMAFGDFSWYWIADRHNRSFERLSEKFAETGQIGFIATQRVDAELILPEAIKLLKMS